MTVPLWRRSSRCNSGGCVEVAIDDTTVRVRNSTTPAAPGTAFTADEWRVFVEGVKAGDFDLPTDQNQGPPAPSE
jgi:hypothetical protein